MTGKILLDIGIAYPLAYPLTEFHRENHVMGRQNTLKYLKYYNYVQNILNFYYNYLRNRSITRLSSKKDF